LIGRYSTNKIAQALRVNLNQITTAVNNKDDFTFVVAQPANMPSQMSKRVSLSSNDESSICSLEIHRSASGMLKVSELTVWALANIINQFME